MSITLEHYVNPADYITQLGCRPIYVTDRHLLLLLALTLRGPSGGHCVELHLFLFSHPYCLLH